MSVAWEVLHVSSIIIQGVPHECDPPDRITQLCGVYDQGHFKLDRSYVYLAVINGISQAVRPGLTSTSVSILCVSIISLPLYC